MVDCSYFTYLSHLSIRQRFALIFMKEHLSQVVRCAPNFAYSDRLGSLTCVVIRIELYGAVIPLRFFSFSFSFACSFSFLSFLVFLLFLFFYFLFLSLLKPIRFFHFSTFSFLALADKSLLTDFWTLSA